MWTAETYRMTFKSGHTKLATKVTSPTGQVVKFMDRIGKREAIRQAAQQLQAHPDQF